MAKKLSMEEMIAQLDSAKKANPLDLSSDQDLSIALMNLVSLEEHFFFSGGKTGKTGFYDMINTVRNMRKDLMGRIVKKSTSDTGEVWCISKHLLAASMRLMEVGTKALGVGRNKEAYGFFEKAYDLYSLFWGVNMGLIDLNGVKKLEGDILPYASGASCDCSLKKSEKSKKQSPDSNTLSRQSAAAGEFSEDTSIVKRLGNWVRNAVNCCIE